MAQDIYVQLNDKGTVYHDMQQRVTVTRSKVAKLKKTAKISKAIRNGLLKELSAAKGEKIFKEQQEEDAKIKKAQEESRKRRLNEARSDSKKGSTSPKKETPVKDEDDEFEPKTAEDFMEMGEEKAVEYLSDLKLNPLRSQAEALEIPEEEYASLRSKVDTAALIIDSFFGDVDSEENTDGAAEDENDTDENDQPETEEGEGGSDESENEDK